MGRRVGKKTRRYKKSKIPKNKDIEEIVEQEDKKNIVNTMEKAVEIMDRRQKFVNDLRKTQAENEKDQQSKKIELVYKRKEAENVDRRRKEAMWQVADKLEEK